MELALGEVMMCVRQTTDCTEVLVNQPKDKTMNEFKLIEYLDLRFDEQARQQAEQARQQAEFNRVQGEFNAVLMAKVERIEQNTIEIKGKILEVLEGASAFTNKEASVKGDEMMDDLTIVEIVENQENPVQVRQKNGKFKNKKYGSVTVWEVAESLGATETHPIPLGNFVSSIMVKIFGFKIQEGKYYPEACRSFIETLVYYYSQERVSVRKY